MSVTIEHGGAVLPSVVVDAYNAELRDGGGFTGDRASKRAFQSVLDDVRGRLAKAAPLGERPTDEFDGEALDKLFAEGSPTQAAVIHTAVEEFAGEFASVIRRFLKQKGWRDTQRIV